MAAEASSTMAMAWSSLLLLSTLAMMVPHVDGATGGGNVGAPAPAVDCTDALLSLAGCLSYVQDGSTVATPDASCCSGLKDVVRKEVACLCQAFQGSQDFGVTLNMTKALQLPDACKVKTPPFSKCHLSIPGVTGGSPAPSPFSGAPFFGGSPSSSTPSVASPAGTGSDSTARAPSPSPSAAAAPFSGAPFFGGSPSSSTPSAASPAGTGSDSTARAPSPSPSAAATFPASTHVFLATVTLFAYHVL